MILDLFWDRLGVVLGTYLGIQNRAQVVTKNYLGGPVFDHVIAGSQDGSKTVPRGLLGLSWGRLGRVLGRSWAVLVSPSLFPRPWSDRVGESSPTPFPPLIAPQLDLT